jgi:hypothetical protein
MRTSNSKTEVRYIVRNLAARPIVDMASARHIPQRRQSMKYLVLGCHPVGDRMLWEENELPGPAMPVSLSPELVSELLAWNEQMAYAILAKVEADSALGRLNSDGESLAKRVAAEVSGGAKVRYLSE